MQNVLIAVAAIAFAAVASAQKVNFGRCANVPVKQNLDLKRYVGVWYEIEKNPFPFGADLKCNQANYSDEGDYISVVNKGVSIRTGRNSSIEGKATIPDKNVTAKLKIKFGRFPFSADYWVLDTDYDQYAVVYSCFSVFNLFNAEYLWILSRTPQLDANVKENIYKMLDDYSIDRTRLSPTLQDC